MSARLEYMTSWWDKQWSDQHFLRTFLIFLAFVAAVITVAVLGIVGVLP
jgi:hypothetical protein